LVWCSNI